MAKMLNRYILRRSFIYFYHRSHSYSMIEKSVALILAFLSISTYGLLKVGLEEGLEDPPEAELETGLAPQKYRRIEKSTISTFPSQFKSADFLFCGVHF